MSRRSVISLFFFAAPLSFACKLAPTSSWFWSDERLISEARVIAHVSVVREIAAAPGFSDYEVKILELIKAPVGTHLRQDSPLQVKGLAPSKIEWKRDQRQGRATYSSDCRYYTNLYPKEEFLLIADGETKPLFHGKSLEALPNRDQSPWYALVRYETDEEVFLRGTPFADIDREKEIVKLRARSDGIKFLIRRKADFELLNYGATEDLQVGDPALELAEKHHSIRFQLKLEGGKKILHKETKSTDRHTGNLKTSSQRLELYP